MCGNLFIHKIDGSKASKSILKRYQKQKSRGSDGFGYIAISNNKLVSYKRAKLESQIEEDIKKEKAETIMFHHRFPTSTPNFKESAHPIRVSNINLKYDYYMIHNGIISNAEDLKEKHIKKGFEYNTEITKKWVTSSSVYKSTCFNDSEALAVELAIAIDNDLPKIETKGSVAFVIAQVEKSSNKINAIYFGRNHGNPLMIEKNSKFISIGSETEGQVVPANILHKLNLKTLKIEETKFEIPYIDYYSGYGYNYGGYDTTFGEDDFDYGENYNLFKEIQDNQDTPEAMKKRWNEIDFEIMQVQTQIDRLYDIDDGSPDLTNSIIELEALVENLQEERKKLDEEITEYTLQYE